MDAVEIPNEKRKAVLIAAHCLFGNGTEENFNEVNLGLIEKIKQAGHQVAVTFHKKELSPCAVAIASKTGATVFAHPTLDPTISFNYIAQKLGVEKKDMLCIDTQLRQVERMSQRDRQRAFKKVFKEQEVKVWESYITCPPALADLKVNFHQARQSRKNFKELSVAIEDFLSAPSEILTKDDLSLLSRTSAKSKKKKMIMNMTQSSLAQQTVETSNKKLVVASLSSIFGFGEEAEVNEKNMGLLRAMQENGCDVVLMWTDKSHKARAEEVQKAVTGIEIVQNPLYADEGRFACIAKKKNIDPLNTLFIIAGRAFVASVNGEGLNLCEAAISRPHALVDDHDLSSEAQKSRANFAKIQHAFSKFVAN